jgi:hypothetical protein
MHTSSDANPREWLLFLKSRPDLFEHWHVSPSPLDPLLAFSRK